MGQAPWQAWKASRFTEDAYSRWKGEAGYFRFKFLRQKSSILKGKKEKKKNKRISSDCYLNLI
jgi:hypothetical protein